MGSPEWLDLAVEQVLTDPGSGAQGPAFPQGLVASSASVLSIAVSNALSLRVEVPDSGGATYVAACMGIKPSGGFSVLIESARLTEDDKVIICLALHEPGPDDFVFQALTSPFAVAVVRDLDPRGKTFSLEAKLNWKVVHVGG